MLRAKAPCILDSSNLNYQFTSVVPQNMHSQTGFRSRDLRAERARMGSEAEVRVIQMHSQVPRRRVCLTAVKTMEKRVVAPTCKRWADHERTHSTQGYRRPSHPKVEATKRQSKASLIGCRYSAYGFYECEPGGHSYF